MNKNKNLNKAKKEKNDEFYTQSSDIENELKHYTNHFKDKIVYCNCDNKDSKFIEYFKTQPIKKLLHSSINEGIDFRSPEAIEILKEADIVVTNPPFSLFRECVAQLVEYKKKFIIVGNNNAITYKEIFKLIKDNKLWLGVNSNKTMEFKLSKEYEKWNRLDEDGNKFGKVPAVSWFTNLTHNKRNEELILYKKYNKNDYPKYDNYDAINVDKVKDIPIDYKGVMGVPITFMDKFNPEQFEILKLIEGKYRILNGKNIYQRLEIKNKRL